ncbi:BED-type domain-containing protein [Citrus sinensis]|nr:BED-type domain-containing protein [Citrus sinensis]
MENEQRVDLDVSETDESVGVRVGMDMAAENNDTAAELEHDSTTVEQGGRCGSGRGRGRRGRGNTTAGASKKRGAGSEGSSSGRLVSDAWNHFKKVKLGKEVQAICNYCGLVMQGHYSQGTNHLINHAKRCPRRSIKNVQQMHLSFSSKADGTTVLSNYSTEPKWDMATVRIFIARMIVMHELPLSFVEYIGFYELLKLLQPSIETISRNTMKAEILKLYDIEKMKAMSVLEACDSRIAVTTDMWTAGNQKKGYMVVTAHYIDNSWVLRSRIMRFIYVPAPHSGEVMCNELYECLMEWNIDRKLSTVTVDNCSANESMIDLLLGKFSASSMIMGGKFLHMRCCAHILNLIVKDGLSVIHKEVEKIRESVHYWTATPSRFEKFEAAKKQLGVKETKNLALDCKTRWNSTYLMLSTSLLYKDVFIRLKERDRNYTSLPSELEWNFSKLMCDYLKSFYKLTELFSGTRYPTSNLFFSKICEIRLSMNAWLQSPIEGVKNMATKMIAKYDKYWDIIHGVLAVGTLLDPRRKMLLINFLFPKIYGERAEFEIERVHKLFVDLVHEYEVKYSSNANWGVNGSANSEGAAADDSIMVDLDLDEMADEWESFRNQNSQNNHFKTEFELYLEESTLPSTSQFDILSWWKNNQGKYPILAKIARDFLAIPVSTVASESAFSTGGRHLSPHRSRLQPSTVEALVCTQNWFWLDHNLKDGIPEEAILSAEQLIDESLMSEL